MDGTSNRARQAFRLKGAMPALTMLCLMTEDIEAIERQLVDHLSQMPQFFLHVPVVVDLSELGDARIDLAKLADLLRRHRLVPVAVQNPSESQRESAIASGFGVLQAPSREVVTPASARRAAPERTPTPPAADVVEQTLAGLTIRTPVRSGQVVYAAGGDLVVLAPVSSGAELIADGNIHVYAPLRGRALAGAHGNPDANIFCMNLEAEFLSIDGYYLMADEIPKDVRGKPARAHLKSDQLLITRL
ncbi:MAG TPA: septum site-determining protein MinC [Polyangiaceae bacterium]|jgi:septum site-determining protein MinC